MRVKKLLDLMKITGPGSLTEMGVHRGSISGLSTARTGERAGERMSSEEVPVTRLVAEGPPFRLVG